MGFSCNGNNMCKAIVSPKEGLATLPLTRRSLCRSVLSPFCHLPHLSGFTLGVTSKISFWGSHLGRSLSCPLTDQRRSTCSSTHSGGVVESCSTQQPAAGFSVPAALRSSMHLCLVQSPWSFRS